MQDLVQYSVVLATTLRGQRSEHSEYSPAVAMLATHLPFLGPSRIARQTQGFKGQGQLVNFSIRTTNEFHTRSEVRQRAPHWR